MEVNIEKVLQGLRRNDSPYKNDQDAISDAISLIKALAEEIEDLKAIAEQYQKQFEEARTDIAREIFEEIDGLVDRNLAIYHGIVVVDKENYDKLKKKRTEDMEYE